MIGHYTLLHASMWLVIINGLDRLEWERHEQIASSIVKLVHKFHPKEYNKLNLTLFLSCYIACVGVYPACLKNLLLCQNCHYGTRGTLTGKALTKELNNRQMQHPSGNLIKITNSADATKWTFICTILLLSSNTTVRENNYKTFICCFLQQHAIPCV